MIVPQSIPLVVKVSIGCIYDSMYEILLERRWGLHTALALSCVLLIAAPGCMSSAYRFQGENPGLRICLQPGEEEAYWFQYAVYAERPFPDFPSGWLDRIAFLIHGTDFSFGRASLFTDPVYSGLGPLTESVSLHLPVKEGDYVYILFAREAREPGPIHKGEKELGLLLHIARGTTPPSNWALYQEGRRIVQFGNLDLSQQQEIRLRPVSASDPEHPAHGAVLNGTYTGWKWPFLEPEPSPVEMILEGQLNGCSSSPREVLRYD